MPFATLFQPAAPGWVPLEWANELLWRHHYLGPVSHGVAYGDELGVMVFAAPRSRRLPPDRFLELVRWCIIGPKNAGSTQWGRVRRLIARELPHITTIVSYSDPSAGHTGSLYRACNWLWAPTWHRLRPPPTGNGNWGSGQQAVKDRWIFPLRPDAEREQILRVEDDGLRRAMPWAEYREKHGGDFKRWKAAR